MADVKISALPAAAALTGAETLPGVQGGATVKLTAQALQRIPVNTQTGTAYTLVAADGGKMVRCNNAAAVSLTVPGSGVMAVGDVVMVRQVGAGQVTASGATLNVPTGVSAKTRALGSVMSLHCVAADTFDVSGDLA
jgi:hypothetical protein